MKNFFAARLRVVANCGDFSLANDDFKPVANSFGKNQTRVGEDHSA
jgi:hypothetical protein